MGFLVFIDPLPPFQVSVSHEIGMARGVIHPCGDVTMNKQTPAQQKKVGLIMREFAKGQLHSGKGGPIVKDRQQAMAIAMSQARKK